MDSMDIDSPIEAEPLEPRDRVFQRLLKLGVPFEYLRMMFSGLVAFVKDNPSWLVEIVATILPTDQEVTEALQESKSGGKKAIAPTMKARFRECMLWLQWLMFLGEPSTALKNLSKMSAGRGVCGAVWGKNDIAYRCRTCEHDPTCAICVPCFQNGNHKDHDYSVIYTGGGCCDCGDVTAWKREGFCSKHKGAEQIQPLPEEYANSVGPVLDALFTIWKNKLVTVETTVHDPPKASYRVSAAKKAANELSFVVVETLLEFCKHSESLLSFVSKRIIALDGLLELLVKAESLLSELVVRKLQELLLKLLGEPMFKYEFAKVFLGYYPFVVRETIKEGSDGALKKYPLLPTFSVQILTVPTLTPRLVKEMNLLAMLLASLRDILDHCAGDNGRLQLTKWANLNEITIRIVEDIRFVMSHNIVPKYVTHKQRGTLRTWMELLCYLQGMSPLKRETGIHIEEENESVNLPFVLCHSVANIHTLLVDGAFSNGEESDNDFLSSVHMEDTDDDDNIRHAKVGRLSQENTVCSSTDMGCASATMTALVKSDVYQLPSSVTYLTCECLKAIETCLECGNASGAQSGCTSSVTGNFLGLKKTLSRIRRGSNIFSARSSNEDKTKQSYLFTHRGSHMGSEVENATGAGHESKTVAENETCSSSFCDSSNEGDNTTESPVFLRLLSSSDWPDIIYDVSTQDISVHIPLHRLLSLLLLKALKTCHGESESRSMNSSRVLTSPSTTYGGFFERLLGGCHPHGFSAFIMEHPLRNRVFSAQVHAGMWRKNGDAAILNFEWYRSVRWSEQGLELDLFLLQCCAALAPADLYITRIIERFGLSDYLSLTTERSSKYEPVLIQEMLTLIIQIVQERRFSGLTPAENLKRELIHKLAVGDATRSQLVKSLPRDLSKCDQLQEILDSIAVYSNPSGLNQGMYSLRWSYWKELDLYHPRWNSRDLQVAEERYMRYCNVSALTTQLPKWTSIYPPLVGASRIATCPVVLQLVRAVVMYAVFNDELVNTRAPDDVLLASLHLLSLALDISCQQGDYDPLLPFLSEDISGELKYDGGELSLLSLLVSLMRMHKRLDSVDFLESGSCNLSALIESFLKKFAEVDRVCMTKLQQLAPEVVIHLSKSMTGEDTSMSAVSSDSEKRKAKARERQAAIMAKMKADQSKFLSSIDSTAEDESNSEPGQTGSDDVQDMEETEDYICSLCHDPNSKTPICFLVLLQKSRLLSFTNRGPLSWNAGQLSDKERVSISTDKITNQSLVNDSVGLGAHSSTQLAQLIQNLINEFSSYSQPGEVTAIIEFVMSQFPLIGNIQVPHGLMDGHGNAAYTTERLEQDLYNSICKSIHCKTTICTSKEEMQKFFTTGDIVKRNVVAESVLVGKYLAALSKERKDHPSSSENAHDNGAQAGHTQHVSVNNGFGPEDCNGIHLSSCGHTVHQACLDRYLSSLRERQSRRIVFEGGHIVDPDQGEFLCPVCRRLANSVLPSLAGDRQNVWKQPIIVAGPSKAAGPLSSAETNSLLLQQASSLLLSAANTVGTEDILRNLPPKSNGGTKLNLDSVSRVLLKMYFPSRLVKLSESGRINLPMIMWDTLKYSLTSIEIAARCGRSRATPNYDLNNLYKELKSSSGFILSLLLKIVQSMKSKNFLGVLQRYRGIQLLAESICSGGYGDHASSGFGGKGNLSCILKHISKEEPYPDTDFWNQVADPILAHNAFSSLMWVLFCLPQPFSSCEESFLSLVHIFYVVSLVQSVLACLGKYYYQTSELFCHDNVITDISKVLGEYGWMQQYFVLNYYNSSSDLKEMIRRLTFPYLRRCALLWRLLSTSVPASFSDGDHTSTASFQSMEDIMGKMDDAAVELRKIQELENIFKIPSLDVALSDQSLRSSVGKWLHHFCKEYGSRRSCSIVYVNPAVPFKLMDLPHVYHDLLQRFLKQRCAQCKNVIEDPALCLLCGKLCSPSFKSCCRETGCRAHAATCGAGTGVYLLIKRTTILLQRSARQAPWPSPYLDAFGEEDFDMHRGKPLYLNEERYAALAYMVASHGLDRSPKVLGQTVIGTLFLV